MSDQIKSLTASILTYSLLTLAVMSLHAFGAPVALASLPLGIAAVIALLRGDIADTVILGAAAVAVSVFQIPLFDIGYFTIILASLDVIYVLGLKQGAAYTADITGKVTISHNDAVDEVHASGVALVTGLGDGNANVTPILGSEPEILQALKAAKISIGDWK